MRNWLLVALLVGCSDDDPKLTCRIGELSGLWRISQEEIDGNCGPIPSETTNLTPGGSRTCSFCRLVRRSLPESSTAAFFVGML